MHKDGSLIAEVLMSAEFVYLSAPAISNRQVEKNDPIPPEIRPNMRKFRMEVVFEGIRNALKQQSFSSGRYKVEVTMGDLRLASGFSGKAFKTNSNFIDPYSSGYLLLPDQFQFWPPIIIKHHDCSQKNPVVIGSAMIRRPEKFLIDEKLKEIQRFLMIQNTEVDVEAQKSLKEFIIEESEPLLGVPEVSQGRQNLKDVLTKFKLPSFLRSSNNINQTHQLSLENEHTWWTKFYNASREEKFRNDCLHELTVWFISFHILMKFYEIFFCRFLPTSLRNKKSFHI